MLLQQRTNAGSEMDQPFPSGTVLLKSNVIGKADQFDCYRQVNILLLFTLLFINFTFHTCQFG